MVIEVNSSNFNSEVLKSPVPVLVDFWAEWCGPCKVMSPIVDQVAEELGGDKIKLVKINVDQNQQLAEQFGIMSIPSFKLFKNGQIVSEFVGSRPKEAVIQFINQNISE